MTGPVNVSAGDGALRSPTDHRELAYLVRHVVDQLSLDLGGLTILTEAATGPFAATAAIAASAGAERVIAVTRDSPHGSARDAEYDTRRVAQFCHARAAIHVVRELHAPFVGASDVITNLGFVRPIDARTVSLLKPTAVVTLMCEAWEHRPGDVDLGACHARGIIVLATNEHASSLPVFSYSGSLAVRLLIDAGFAVMGTRVAVLGRDPFTPVISDTLAREGAVVRQDRQLTPASVLDTIAGADVVLVADYASDDVVIGDGGVVGAAEFARAAPGATVVQFAGVLDAKSLAQHGVRVVPWPIVGARRMSRTFAHLGARPVVELHAAGLKVGECGARARLAGLAPPDALEAARRCSELVQLLH